MKKNWTKIVYILVGLLLIMGLFQLFKFSIWLIGAILVLILIAIVVEKTIKKEDV